MNFLSDPAYRQTSFGRFNHKGVSVSENKTGYPLTVLLRKFPDPLIIKKEEKFDVSATIRVTRKLPSKFLVDLVLWRKAGFWFKIPCIKNVGSW